MARYNTTSGSTSINGATTISSPNQGAFTNLTGTAPYTVTLPAPALFPGSNQTFYNATAGTITLSTPSGNFVGTGASGTSSNSVFTGNVLSVTSDGTNYVVISEDGSPLIATTGTFSSDVTINGASATVNIQPSSLILYPGSTGAMDRVNIGVNTRASGAFTSLAANAQVSFTAGTASSSTGTGSLVVTGGVGVSGNIWSGATVNASSVVATGLTGTIQTAAQPNITSLGTITSLSAVGIATSTLSASSTITSAAAAPFSFQNNGNNATYTQSVVYANQNNTSGDSGNGIFIERGRLSDSGSAEVRSFVIGARGGQIQLIVNKDGYLGVGTASPTTKLHLYESGVADVALRLTPADPNRDALLQMTGQGNDLTQEGFEIWYVNNVGDVHLSTTYPNDAAAIRFHTRTGGSKSTSNERLTILGNGNIGIGYTSAQAPLSFANSVGNKIDLYHTTGGAGDRYGFQVQSSELRIHSGTGGDASGGITLGKSNTSSFTEAMRVRNDSTVTIGNSAFSGGAVTSGTYTHFEKLNSPQTVTRTNWGKSSNMEANQYRGGPSYNMPFVMYFETPANESNSANTYYPVSFNTPGHGGGQFGNMVITRRYYDTGPAQRGGASIGWNDSSTHQGGLEAWFHVGESAWSDYYSARLLYYRYTYHNTISDYGMMLTSDSRFGSGPFWVRLRGGFVYWVHSTFPISPANVTPGGTVFYYPTEGNTYQTWPGTVTSVQNTNFNSNQVWGTL
jgi:hypothetical protein